VRFQTTIRAIGYVFPRSTCHHSSASIPEVWVTEPPPKFPSVFPSIALSGIPPKATLDWVAVPARATFTSSPPARHVKARTSAAAPTSPTFVVTTSSRTSCRGTLPLKETSTNETTPPRDGAGSPGGSSRRGRRATGRTAAADPSAPQHFVYSQAVKGSPPVGSSPQVSGPGAAGFARHEQELEHVDRVGQIQSPRVIRIRRVLAPRRLAAHEEVLQREDGIRQVDRPAPVGVAPTEAGAAGPLRRRRDRAGLRALAAGPTAATS